MDVLMLAAELGPHARATPAADSIAALAKSIRQLGHTVTLALPRTPGFVGSGLLLARRLSPLVLEPGLEVTVLDGQLASGVSLVLFDSPEFQAERPIFGAPGSAEAEADASRFSLFARAAAALVRERREHGKSVDVVHAHDWPAAPVAALLNGPGAPPTILTLHELVEERTYDPARASLLGPLLEEPKARVGARISPLRLGLLAARTVTTVSAGYAQALMASHFAPLFGGLSEPLVGVLPGVDYSTFNPATDAALESRFDAEDASNKGRSKTALIRSLSLELDTERPLLVALVSGMDEEGRAVFGKGLGRLLELDLTLVVAGALDGPLSQKIERLRAAHPDTLGLVGAGEDAELRRRLAAADFSLTARADTPAPYYELVSERYGALPIAAASGGVPDAVVDLDAELETGTGFLYSPGSVDDLVGAVQRALSAYRNPAFTRVRKRVMRRDLGWDRPARRYVQIYRNALGQAS
jgi:starch synthase